MKSENRFFTDTIVIQGGDQSTEPTVSDTTKARKFHFEPVSLISEICTNNTLQNISSLTIIT